MKHYNTTDLDPLTTFERHVFHRDQFAHYLRWTHILKEAKIGDTTAEVIKELTYKGTDYYLVKLPSGKKQYINKKYVTDDHPKT